MIRVMVEQYCQSGKEAQLRGLLIELRKMAMEQRGYISGETLRELINPSVFIVISTWTTLDAWKAWQGSKQRFTIEERMESLTTDSRKLRILTVDDDT